MTHREWEKIKILSSQHGRDLGSQNLVSSPKGRHKTSENEKIKENILGQHGRDLWSRHIVSSSKWKYKTNVKIDYIEKNEDTNRGCHKERER